MKSSFLLTLLMIAISSIIIQFASANQIKLLLFTESSDCTGSSQSAASYKTEFCYNRSTSTSTIYSCNASDIYLKTFSTSAKCVTTAGGAAPEEQHIRTNECTHMGSRSMMWVCINSAGKIVAAASIVLAILVTIMVALL
jgi:hypothetical protein